MQLSLIQYGANKAGEPTALGKPDENAPEPNGGLAPVIIDLDEDATQERARGFIYRAVELLNASISGCAPKK